RNAASGNGAAMRFRGTADAALVNGDSSGRVYGGLGGSGGLASGGIGGLGGAATGIGGAIATQGTAGANS
ncbi:MAG: hypothetical protein EBX95_11090, partial [Acidimicrobiia bacterium]|nr:hypothetical protein [Acidimicrobiia bacterium]